MPSDPKLRASDADRERTVTLLSKHLAAGRLTAEELDERLEAALSLREIARSYLKSAGEVGNLTVWEARLRLAAKLEKEAAAINHCSINAVSN